MEKCFVIQPFNEKYNKRYSNEFEPSIKNAGFEPYRVDKDPGTKNIIRDIEDGISNCSICFADITTDNPNVWYELGFAFALKKDVIMVCCKNEREGAYPFDVSHMSIIEYSSEATSDFVELKSAITKKIKAFQKQSGSKKIVDNIPIKELSECNIAFLVSIAEDAVVGEGVSFYTVKTKMLQNRGFDNIEASISLRELDRDGFIEITPKDDEYGNAISFCKLTRKGEDWILSNKDKLKYKKKNINTSNYYDPF
ncbi:MAG: hypothetical protein LBB84_03720 [Tannerellaceae bacterium]|jgi:nucleoside 2-deoxyribosyltransferase|nr:hypothetical protein [Tannerellaceae bacterium]